MNTKGFSQILIKGKKYKPLENKIQRFYRLFAYSFIVALWGAEDEPGCWSLRRETSQTTRPEGHFRFIGVWEITKVYREWILMAKAVPGLSPLIALYNSPRLIVRYSQSVDRLGSFGKSAQRKKDTGHAAVLGWLPLEILSCGCPTDRAIESTASYERPPGESQAAGTDTKEALQRQFKRSRMNLSILLFLVE
ncbi:hypothetical protein RRG08_008029 [Elysia crispata]|uniref:Uncharacterized protein n=1 Tax=Elysia crispata TaxID=231223 RepID=A0AAE1AHC8_9GAST|nr:hypothetical protein RRG08_008029 [Elysia crispata]